MIARQPTPPPGPPQRILMQRAGASILNACQKKHVLSIYAKAAMVRELQRVAASISYKELQFTEWELELSGPIAKVVSYVPLE